MGGRDSGSFSSSVFSATTTGTIPSSSLSALIVMSIAGTGLRRGLTRNDVGRGRIGDGGNEEVGEFCGEDLADEDCEA